MVNREQFIKTSLLWALGSASPAFAFRQAQNPKPRLILVTIGISRYVQFPTVR